MPGENEGEELGLRKLSDMRQKSVGNGGKPPGILQTLRKYPKGVFFILGNEFCERFSYYGMRVVLLLYFLHVHNHPYAMAKLLYHLFTVICYFTPLVGSIAADGCLGKFKTILYGSIVYCFGHVLLTSGSIPGLNRPAMMMLDFCGLFVIACATGAIKPCVAAFAADQFPPHMTYEREAFFGFFYFSVNMGSLLSDLVNPLLRGAIPSSACFGQEECFPLAFGLPAILMFIATIIFISGKPFYKVDKPLEGNVIVKVTSVYAHAIRDSCSNPSASHDHWLDRSREKFGPQLVEDVKQLSRMVIIFVPTIFFWALFDQQGSTWIIQAENMDGNVGFMTILPEQLGVLNPLLIVILIPVLTAWIYPRFHRWHFLDKPLKRMFAGGVLAGLSFVIAGFVQLSVNESMIQGPPPVYVANNLNCEVKVTAGNESIGMIKGSIFSQLRGADVMTEPVLHLKNPSTCETKKVTVKSMLEHPWNKKKATVFAINSDGDAFLYQVPHKKAKNGQSKVFLFPAYELDDRNRTLSISGGQDEQQEYKGNFSEIKLQPSVFGSKDFDIKLKVDQSLTQREPKVTAHQAKNVHAWTGSVKALFLWEGTHVKQLSEPKTLFTGNSVSLLWQVPQYLVITVGEIFLSVTGLEFAYEEGPKNLKSVLLAFWLLTSAFGNLLDMIISGSLISDPTIEFFTYAAMMIAVMVIFAIVSRNYVYRTDSRDSEADEDTPLSGQEKLSEK